MNAQIFETETATVILIAKTERCGSSEVRQLLNQFRLDPVEELPRGKVAVNLSISSDVLRAMKVFLAENPHIGTLSGLTERLWVSYLRENGVVLPI